MEQNDVSELQNYTGHKRKVFAWEHMTEKKIYKNDGLGVF